MGEHDAASLRKAKVIVLYIYIYICLICKSGGIISPPPTPQRKKNMYLLTQVDWKGCFFLGDRGTKGMTV